MYFQHLWLKQLIVKMTHLNVIIVAFCSDINFSFQLIDFQHNFHQIVRGILNDIPLGSRHSMILHLQYSELKSTLLGEFGHEPMIEWPTYIILDAGPDKLECCSVVCFKGTDQLVIFISYAYSAGFCSHEELFKCKDTTYAILCVTFTSTIIVTGSSPANWIALYCELNAVGISETKKKKKKKKTITETVSNRHSTCTYAKSETRY